MSLKVVRRILENPGCIEAHAWNLLIAMASFGHDDGTSIYASMETLANTCGIDRATGWRALPKLLKSGLVIDTGGKHKSEHGSPTTIWRINLSKLPFKASQDATLSLQDDAPIVSQDSPKCRKQAPKASQDATQTEVRRPGYNPGIPTVVENNRIGVCT